MNAQVAHLVLMDFRALGAHREIVLGDLGLLKDEHLFLIWKELINVVIGAPFTAKRLRGWVLHDGTDVRET